MLTSLVLQIKVQGMNLVIAHECPPKWHCASIGQIFWEFFLQEKSNKPHYIILKEVNINTNIL